MLQIINQAMMSGFTAAQILKFISAKIPKLQSGIQQAQEAGFDPDKILKFLSYKIPHSKEAANKQINANDRYLSSIGIKTKEEKEAARNKALSGALQVGAGALGTYALSRAIPAGVSAVSSLLGNQEKNLLSQSAEQTPQSLMQPQNSHSQQPPIPPNAAVSPASILQQPVSPQVINPVRDIKKSVDILKNLGFDANVKNMLDGKMNPADIAGVLKTTMPKDKIKALEAQEGGIEGVVNDFAQFMQMPEQIASEKIVEPENEVEKTIEPLKPIAKNSVVSSPSGIGEVKEIRNGKALVEIDGKLHKIAEDELEHPGFSEDEIADAYDNLMAKIPEEHKSGFISWAGYDEDRNVIGFIPRGGKYEELHNITPEEAEIVKTGKGVARTSGETREGLWIVGEDTRGGLISQIIHDRRRKKEQEEKRQGKFAFELPKKEKEDKGMKPIFDEMAHARGLSRERERKKKLEEKERKKRAKR